MSPEQALAITLVRGRAEPSRDRLAAIGEAARSANLESTVSLLARIGALAPLSDLLMGQARDRLSPDTATRMGAARTAAQRRGLLQHGLTSRLARGLHEQGIPAVALKGAALADAVYGDLGARESADIDLLVAPEHLDPAVEALEGLGWREPMPGSPEGSLPALHRELGHPALPPVEVHWRVHWYESDFAQAALARARPTDHGWLRLTPADELAFLLLFLARDGFAGLRQVVDVAAWWASAGCPGRSGDHVSAIAGRHPALAPALAAAARYAERMLGIPPGSLHGDPPTASRRQRSAVALANPWLEGSRHQIDAEVSLVDGLLSPPRSARAFARRQILPPDAVLIRRQPHLHGSGAARLHQARAVHAVRVVGRYALAPGRVIARARR